MGTLGHPFACALAELLESRLLFVGGELDPFFGNAGHVATTFGTLVGSDVPIVVQPDRKIVVGGSVNRDHRATPTADFGLLRFNPDGSVDRTFGAKGQAFADIEPFDGLNQLVL